MDHTLYSPSVPPAVSDIMKVDREGSSCLHCSPMTWVYIEGNFTKLYIFINYFKLNMSSLLSWQLTAHFYMLTAQLLQE